MDILNSKKVKKRYHGGIPEIGAGRVVLARERQKKADQVIDEIYADQRKIFRAKIREVDEMSLKIDPIKYNNEHFELDNLLWAKAD